MELFLLKRRNPLALQGRLAGGCFVMGGRKRAFPSLTPKALGKPERNNMVLKFSLTILQRRQCRGDRAEERKAVGTRNYQCHEDTCTLRPHPCCGGTNRREDGA